MINEKDANKKLMQLHNFLYKKDLMGLRMQTEKHRLLKDNVFNPLYMDNVFVYNDMLCIPVYDTSLQRNGYVVHHGENDCTNVFPPNLENFCFFSEYSPLMITVDGNRRVNHNKDTQFFLCRDTLTGLSFFNFMKLNCYGDIVVVCYLENKNIDVVYNNIYANHDVTNRPKFVVNNYHTLTDYSHSVNVKIISDEENIESFWYPPKEYGDWQDFYKSVNIGNLDDKFDDVIKRTFSKPIENEPIQRELNPVEVLAEHIPKEFKEMVDLEASTHINKKKSLDLGFFDKTLEDLSAEYTNVPKEHLKGLLRNIIANTFQRLVKCSEKTPITEQSIFVLSSGEGKTSLCEALTDTLTDYFNDKEYEKFRKLNSDYLATKNYLENKIKDSKDDLELLKSLQLKLQINEDNKPYCQTLTQTMNTSIFNIPEEVLKGARQNWLFSDEAGATMSTTLWKGEYGNALIQYLCGAWSDTCKLSSFKTDNRYRPQGRASKSEIRDCSTGLLAMTQHGYFDKMNKEEWIDGGWLARLNLYISERKPLTLKNREKVVEIGKFFQKGVISLIEKIIDSNTKGYLFPSLNDTIRGLFRDAQVEAIELANALKDESLDPIYNRMEEKALRTATVYALINYATTGKFEITEEVAKMAIDDTWYNLESSIKFIKDNRIETAEKNPNEIEQCIIRACKNNNKNTLLTINEICKHASNKTRQNLLLKNKDVIKDYLESHSETLNHSPNKFLRLEDNSDIYWFEILISGKVRINYKLKYKYNNF